ncbi:Ig-like domain-containing protein [Bosea rubneri]|uniref:Ig-like domain-containing protein n=1 Tax=Bosea rubneri TaxID=3075434 RepID=A0ABU3S6M3_9HYPH|nr:Ig-like domain-containing protein [Bosea sp. ZW T0_25]MDU0340438.1 Ig-like domain-containing protein [Bosea sp. ZW T0_25]
MPRILIFSVGFCLVGAAAPAQMLRVNCQTVGPQYHIVENTKLDYDSLMDKNGCRYSYTTSGITLEKSVIAKAPANGTLTQTGIASFFYTPKENFIGKDNFAVYVCGTGRRGKGSGCARFNYNVTVH